MKRRGFTLLEVLVATAIMAAAVVGLLSNLSTSLQNASRLTDYDRGVMLARRTMEELLARPVLPKRVELTGVWDAKITGVEGGWRARVMPFERPPNAAPGQLQLERIELEVWWSSGGQRRTFPLEAFRTGRITPEDLAVGAIVP